MVGDQQQALTPRGGRRMATELHRYRSCRCGPENGCTAATLHAELLLAVLMMALPACQETLWQYTMVVHCKNAACVI